MRSTTLLGSAQMTGVAVSARLLAGAIRLGVMAVSRFASRLHNLGRRLASLQQKIERFTNRTPRSTLWRGGKPSRGPAVSVRYKVLYLNSFGHPIEEIAQQVGMRAVEVDFILRLENEVRAAHEAT